MTGASPDMTPRRKAESLPETMPPWWPKFMKHWGVEPMSEHEDVSNAEAAWMALRAFAKRGWR